MDKNTAIKMMQGDLPNIKTLCKMILKLDKINWLIMNTRGYIWKTTIPQEFMGFSLSPKQALAFRDFSFSGARQKKDEDFVLMEYDNIPTDMLL
jgi:hypothetical protein